MHRGFYLISQQFVKVILGARIYRHLGVTLNYKFQEHTSFNTICIGYGNNSAIMQKECLSCWNMLMFSFTKAWFNYVISYLSSNQVIILCNFYYELLFRNTVHYSTSLIPTLPEVVLKYPTLFYMTVMLYVYTLTSYVTATIVLIEQTDGS